MGTAEFALKRDDLTLNSRLVSGLRDAIIDGRLQPGRHLTERELCDMFQVSRSLVRQAIQTLAAEELITVVPHRGLMVSLLDRKSARELYKVRAALEGLVVAEFTRNADENHRRLLFEAASQLEKLSEDDTPQALVEAKNIFYARLLAGCGNDVAAQMFHQLNNRIVQLRRLSLSQQGRLPQTLREIGAIMDAVRERDEPLARRLAEEHVAAAAVVADLRFAEMEVTRKTRKDADHE